MSEPDVSDLLTVAEAIRVIDETPVAPRVIEVQLADAQGLRLAQDILSDRDYPPFDKSLMDGFAVRTQDVATTPASLALVGEIAAGQVSSRTLEAHQAMAIMTGTPLPSGADGVVPVEDTEKSPPNVRILCGTAPGRFIARRGSDVRANETVLRAGTKLESAQLAVAASVGAARVKVFARPRVAVLSTGDELVPIDQTPAGSQIRNSNNLMLVALLRKFGCDVRDLGVARDQPDAIRAAMLDGIQSSDVLFVTGGMSMGEYDWCPRVMRDLGVDLRITKLKIKPGKPFVFGVREGSAFGSEAQARRGFRVQDSEKKATTITSSLNPEPSTLNPSFVFGLPGNPVSGFVCTIRLASRLLARLAGGSPEPRWIDGRLASPLPANGPREFYQPVVLESSNVRPLSWKGSADVFTLAAANRLMPRAENEPALAVGGIVRVLEI